MQNDPWSPHLHQSRQTPYPHTDYNAPAGKIHLQLDESQFLAQKRGVELRPTDSIPPSMLNDLLNRDR